jgi:SAM-dependent methyltransferase
MRSFNLFRKRSAKNLSNKQLIHDAYNLVLNRAPDPEGLALYETMLNSGGVGREELFRTLLMSAEYKNISNCSGKYSYRDDSQYDGFIDDSIDKCATALKDYDFISIEDMDRAATGLADLEYYVYHKKRFLEMMNALAFMERDLGVPLNIMEIGSIFTTKIIRDLFPNANISALDALDINEIGYEDVYILSDIVSEYYKIDLVRDEIADIEVNKNNKFDVVLLCEVVEHLLLNPIKLFKFIFRQMNSGGYLYITTPNALKKENVELFERRRMPFPVYPENYSYKDAFMFHVREYGMAELLGYIRSAGGVVRGFYFSDCWDDPAYAANLAPHERGNLVVLAQKP